jgi:hypothetical protein
VSFFKWRASAEEYDSFSSKLYLRDFITFRLKPIYQDKIFLSEKYVKERLSIAQIAAISFSSKPTVRKYLVRFGIALRSAHLPHGRTAQQRYGLKVRHGKVIEHLAEQRVVNAVNEMHSKGLSLRNIAKFLTSVGVPTKCRGKAWHPEMVRRLLPSKGEATTIECEQEFQSHGQSPLSLSYKSSNDFRDT